MVNIGIFTWGYLNSLIDCTIIPLFQIKFISLDKSDYFEIDKIEIDLK